MTRRPAAVFLAAAVLCGCVILTGCSLIGLGLGAFGDSRKKPAALPGWQVESVRRGSAVLVTARDGRVIGGKYDGIADMPLSEYARRYAALQAQADAPALPALGPGAKVTTVNGANAPCELFGFTTTAVAVRFAGRDDVSRILFTSLLHVADASGRSIDSAALRQLVLSSRLPLLTQIVVRTAAGKTRLGVDEVARVDVPSHKGKMIGFLVGAFVDVAVVVAVAVSGTSPRSVPCEQTPEGCILFSCPFVYSFDGAGYRLDSETFGGAIFEKGQRADLDNLDHAREVDGAYRLRLANELPETQYVDQMQLVVADHPTGTRVMPDFAGGAHLIAAAVPPARALDLENRNVTALVRAVDGDAWVSNPFGRDPEDAAAVRDGFVADFARPRGATSVKLAFNVQNTLWAASLLGPFLELHGEGLDDWYRLLDTSADERKRLHGAMLREAMLRVAVWDAGEWREAGFVWAVGPALPKDQVVRVDIGDVPGDLLRVRVDSTAGLWMVDSLQADFSPDRPLRLQRVAPATARDQRGADITGLLGEADGRRYTMPTRDDWAEVTFPAPPPVPGLVRSVLLEATGYYTIHASGRGEPQTRLVDSLLSEPGAYGRYTLQLLNRRVTELVSRTAETAQ